MSRSSIRDSWLSCCERSLSSCSDNTVHAPVKPRSSCVYCSSLPADPSSPVGESALPPVSNPLRLKQVNNAQQLIQRLSEVDGTSLVFTWRCNEVFASLGDRAIISASLVHECLSLIHTIQLSCRHSPGLSARPLSLSLSLPACKLNKNGRLFNRSKVKRQGHNS